MNEDPKDMPKTLAHEDSSSTLEADPKLILGSVPLVAHPIRLEDVAKMFKPTRKPRNADRSANLGELRGKIGLSQKDLAKKMGVAQGTLSKLESRGDMRISALSEYVQALGGECKFIAIINGRSYDIAF